MTLELLIGPYRSGKTGRLLQELVASKKEHPLDHCLLLVPSHRYGRLLRAQLIECLRSSSMPGAESYAPGAQSDGQTTGLFGVQIATIYEACEQVLRTSGNVPTVLSRDLCVAVLAQALERLNQNGELSHLKSIADFAGTSSSMLRLIDEMERASFTPSEVIATVNDTAASSSRHIELAKVFKEYWLRLDELGCTDQKRLALSCRELLVKKKVPGLHLRWLIIDGFDRISPLQAEVMHGLSQHAANTRIAFDYVLPEDRGAEASEYDAAEDDYSWKESSYAELTRRFVVTPSFLALPGAPAAPQQTGFRTLDRFMEMEEIARRCKMAIVNKHVSPGQVLVTARDVAHYAQAARAAFENAGLPYFIDEAIEYLSLPPMKAFLTGLTLALEDFPRAATIECLRSRYLKTSKLGITPANVDTLDKKSMDAGLVGGAKAWTSLFERLLSPELAETMSKLFNRLTAPATGTLSFYCQWIEDVAEDLFDLAKDKEASEPLQGLRATVRTLMLQEQLLGRHAITYEQFLSRFRLLLEQATFRRQQPVEAVILVSSAEQAPNRRFDEVFVAGVAEGQFPKHSGESGFVSADERAKWCTFGVDISNPREHAGFERALFRSLVERARRNICFSYHEVDFGGEEMVPSFYLSDGTTSIKTVDSIEPARAAMRAPVSARNAISGWLWLKPGIELPEHFESHPLLNEYWDVVSIPLLGAYRRHEKNLSNAYNGYLSDLTESGWLEIKLPSTWSASALNKYGECPFKFWLAQMVKVEPRKEPQPELSVLVRGKLYHKALELYYMRLFEHDRRTNKSIAKHDEPKSELIAEHDNAKSESITELDKEGLLASALRDAIESFKDDPEFRPGPYWQNDQNDMLFRLRRFVAYDEQRMQKDKTLFRPGKFEARFGFKFGDSSPPLVIDTKYGAATIRGAIDRIDIAQHEDGSVLANVIDYKSGSTAIPVDDARKGANLQLPIYALAVQRAIMPGAQVMSGHYLGISAAKSNGSIDFKHEKMADLLDGTEEHIRNAVAGVAQGDFTVRPYGSKACKNCDFKPACRITDLKNSDEDLS